MRGTRRPYVGWALAGTALAFLLLLLDVHAYGQGMLAPIRPGVHGPSAAVVARDFPDATLARDIGLDGQQFYAIAREPLHPDAVAASLDHPRYRYQRILYPLLAWVLHPSGGGPGLVVALVAVGLAALLLGALALGALSDLVRGPPWVAMLFPLLPGTVWALTSSTADGLAVALSLLTIVATLRGRSRLAWCAAVAAVLTRETTILVPLALVLARRRREDLPLLVLPALAFGGWLAVVHAVMPATAGPEHLWFPLTGLIRAARTEWWGQRDLAGMASTLSALVIGVTVLVRRRGPSELRWMVGVQLASLSLCGPVVLGDDFGATRSTLLLLTVAVAALLSGTRTVTPDDAVRQPVPIDA